MTSRGFTNSPISGDEPSGQRRPVRKHHRPRGVGHMEAVPSSRPVVSVGRYTAWRYCPACGAKRTACRCEATS